jgi:hypothetical protein
MLTKVSEIQITESWGKNPNKLEWRIMNYWGGENRYFINNNDSKEFQTLFKFINDMKNVNINKGDKVYASKASELPRFKLKEFIKDKGLKKTSRYNQADIIIFNKGHFNQMIKELKFKEYTFIKGDFISDKINKKDTNEQAYKLFKDTIKSSSDKDNAVLVNDQSVKYMEEKFGQKYPADKVLYDDNTVKVKGTYIDLYRNTRTQNLINILFELRKEILNGDIKVIFDEDMFVTLNKEGIELDDEYLQTLRDMLFSSDKANVKLGFEMMSNLVVNEHMLLSVSFLLNEMIHTTNFRPSYYTSSNTNLKSLLKVLSTRGIRWERDWKTFGTGLRNNFKTGKEGEIVKKFLLDNINREFKISNSAAESLVDIVFTTEAQ